MRRCCILIVCAVLAMGIPTAYGQTHSIVLEWQAEHFDLPVDRYAVPDADIRFRVEPTYAGTNIERIVLPLGDNPDDYLGMVIDRDAELLYIDANRNLDLTDDPGPFPGTLTSASRMQFDELFLELEHDGVRVPYVVSFSVHFGRSDTRMSFVIHSGWEGRLDIDGTSYRMAVVPDLSGRLDKNGWFAFEPVAPEKAAASHATIPTMVVADVQPYDLSLAFAESDEAPAIQGSLQASDADMGVLEIDGRHIASVTLEGPAQITATEAGALVLPAGTYTVQQVHLEDGWTYEAPPYRRGHYDAPPYGRRHTVHVPIQGETHLMVGGPIRETITARRSGRFVSLSYENEGVDGFAYQNENWAGPPGFVVLKGDKEIAAGTFEYG